MKGDGDALSHISADLQRAAKSGGALDPAQFCAILTEFGRAADAVEEGHIQSMRKRNHAKLDRIKALESENGALKQECSRLAASVAQLQARDAAVEACKKQTLAAMEIENEKLKQTCAELAASLKSCGQSNMQGAETVARGQDLQKVEALELANNSLRKDCSRLSVSLQTSHEEQQRTTMQTEQLKAEISALTEAGAKLKGSVESQQDALNHALLKIQSLEKENDTLKKDCGHLKSTPHDGQDADLISAKEISKLRKENAALKAECSKLANCYMGAIGSSQEGESFRQTRETRKREHRDALKKAAACRSSLEELQSKHRHTLEKLSQLSQSPQQQSPHGSGTEQDSEFIGRECTASSLDSQSPVHQDGARSAPVPMLTSPSKIQDLELRQTVTSYRERFMDPTASSLVRRTAPITKMVTRTDSTRSIVHSKPSSSYGSSPPASPVSPLSPASAVSPSALRLRMTL